MLVLTSQITLSQYDACSRCGTRLSALYAIYLADCGRYCSRGCADEQAEVIAAAAVVTDFEAVVRDCTRLERAGIIAPRDEDE